MLDRLTVLDGSTFCVSEPNGDISLEEGTGFFHEDVRHLCVWRLRIDGQPIRLLSAQTPDYYLTRIFGTLAGTRIGETPQVSIRRDRIVADGIDEDLTVWNHGPAREVLVEYEVDADFADVFEMKVAAKPRGEITFEVRNMELELHYTLDRVHRGTRIAFEHECEIEKGKVTFRLQLGEREQWRTHIEIIPMVEDDVRPPRHRCDLPGRLQPQMPLTFEEWMEDAPKLDTDFDVLRHAYRQSLVDLAALRFRPFEEIRWALPAAGLPWFMALFGRDSLITAYQAIAFQARPAAATLEALAGYQATETDDFRDMEPGKILHELRKGTLTVLGEIPHRPYYGTHDATPLFLVLLEEYERWTGDDDLIRRLEPAARAAIEWIRGPGDPDGDGYLEYRTRSSRGLENHGWKDSGNSIRFADGSQAEPPIAVCEVQGYAYDARLRTARLAREIWGDREYAAELEGEAGALKQRFDRDFWVEDRGHYALALDGEKRQVDSLTSNVGHLLWSGIVPEERAGETVKRLMAEDMFTGWGIRTMSASDGAYNPIEYHNGTVWPHDTSIIAAGMRRYGFREEASLLSAVLIEAADPFEYRLPEVFAGFQREDTVGPVEYPTASRPQAWAAGAPLLAIRTLLGMDSGNGALIVEPSLPEAIGRLRLSGLPFRGERLDVP